MSLYLNGQKIQNADVSISDKDVNINFKDGSPKGVVVSSSNLPASGDTGIYITRDTGHWWYYEANAWHDGGVYQANGVSESDPVIERINATIYDIINCPKRNIDLEEWEQGSIYGTSGENNNEDRFKTIRIRTKNFIPVYYNNLEVVLTLGYSIYIYCWDKTRNYLGYIPEITTTSNIYLDDYFKDCGYIRIVVKNLDKKIDISDCKNLYIYFNYELLKNVLKVSKYVYSTGYIDFGDMMNGSVSNKGVLYDSNTRIKSEFIKVSPGTISYKISTGYKMAYNIFSSKSSSSLIAQKYWFTGNGLIEVDNDCYIIFVLAKNDDSNINPDESKNLTLWNKDLETTLENSGIIIPEIVDMPKDIIAMPTIKFSDTDFSNSKSHLLTKYGVHRNNNEFVITFARNVDNTAEDFPSISTSGKMEVEYQYFTLDNDVMNNVSTGVIAKIGSSYINKDGVNSVFTGGCGYSSIVNSRLYFSSAFKDNNSLTLNGQRNYGLIPCVSVLVNNGAALFDTPRELTLNIDGTIDRFDMNRFNDENSAIKDNNYWNYYTSNPPCYDTTKGYMWLQPIRGGFVFLKSTDGINWTFVSRINTPYIVDREVACEIIGNYLCFCARSSRDGNSYSTNNFIGLLNVTSGKLIKQYRLPAYPNKPTLVKTGNDLLLFYTPSFINQADVIRISLTGWGEDLKFYKWFSIYNCCTQYITLDKSSVINNNFTDMYLIGGNGDVCWNTGSTFIHLQFDEAKPHSISSMPFIIE